MRPERRHLPTRDKSQTIFACKAMQQMTPRHNYVGKKEITDLLSRRNVSTSSGHRRHLQESSATGTTHRTRSHNKKLALQPRSTQQTTGKLVQQSRWSILRLGLPEFVSSIYPRNREMKERSRFSNFNGVTPSVLHCTIFC